MFGLNKQKETIKVKPKMKIGEVQYEFRKHFGVSLRVFHKLQLVSAEVQLGTITNSTQELTISGNHTISEIVELFDDVYKLKIQIADKKDMILLNEQKKLRE